MLSPSDQTSLSKPLLLYPPPITPLAPFFACLQSKATSLPSLDTVLLLCP